ncbi:2Fe-2S iron-sulfur cluster-binding protein [Pelodictyon luteolum]|uniref:Chlorosome envelope protein I n=1 Tax=Chlorobium luteolum (strain DSM 273 / BCRC 81028 / 2530) TaxID=319225 RepID=Q3B4H4_CHLL3|nr:2Fe-2S iron-sulfur cluster-binding protein [Pelodictyon luteolum]ABB23757.1 chlorosome envelope protein I [Pelodictyon luteolum DSM 273]
MNITINEKAAVAAVGQKLIHVAQKNHSHVGYVCAGNGVCQTCYVTVEEGAECLSPLSDVEKAFLSERQINAGGRMACQAVLEKEGTVTILSRPEEVRSMLFNNPLGLFSYGADMGRDTAEKIRPGISNLIARIQTGELKSEDPMGELMKALTGAVNLVIATLPDNIPFGLGEQLKNLASSLPRNLNLSLPLNISIPFLSAGEEKKNTLIAVPVTARKS